MAYGRLVIVLCRGTTHGAIRVEEKVSVVKSHVVLLRDVGALDGAVLESKVAPSLHGGTANVSQKLSARRICRLVGHPKEMGS